MSMLEEGRWERKRWIIDECCRDTICRDAERDDDDDDDVGVYDAKT